MRLGAVFRADMESVGLALRDWDTGPSVLFVSPDDPEYDELAGVAGAIDGNVHFQSDVADWLERLGIEKR